MLLALFGLDVDDAGHGLPVFRVESAGYDFEFFDGCGVDIKSIGIAGERVLHRLAVDDVEALISAAAADMDLVVLNDDAELFADQIVDAFDYFLLDLIRRDVLLRGGDVSLEEWLFADNFDRLAQSEYGRLEREIYLRGLFLLNPDAGANLHGIANDRSLEVIITGSEPADLVGAIHIGDRPFVGPGHRDIDARQGFIGPFVDHPATDKRGLRPCGRCAKNQEKSKGGYF